MARTFDGSNDQIAYGSDGAVDNVSAFTAAVLVRITADVADERQLFTKMRSDYLGKMYLCFQGSSTDKNVLAVIVTRGSGTDAVTLSVANAVSLNTWTVVIGTWDGSAAPKLYACALGGTIAELSYGTTSAGSGTPTDDSTATVRLGARDPLDASFYAGGLAECALWNRVLSLGEISALGRGYSPRFFPNGRVLYSPVDGRSSPEFNYDGTSGTVTEATYLEHPRVIYPAGPPYSKGGSSSPPVIIPSARGCGRGLSRGLTRF